MTFTDKSPIIGLTTDLKGTDVVMRDRYYRMVVEAGGVPILLPPVKDEQVLETYVESIDALLLTGGGDCHPRWQGEEASELLGRVCEERDWAELHMIRSAADRQMPILGICRGMQMLVTAFGGHVAQDISLDKNRRKEKGVVHVQQEERPVKTHSVRMEKNSTLYTIYNKKEMMVNSFHHQTTDGVPKGLRATAYAVDGVVEAVESTEGKAIVGVQWHPEWLEDGAPIFSWLTREASLYKQAKSIHKDIVSLDSHCDTASLCLKGGDFTRRDPDLQVDLVKMGCGLMDVATMAAYVPQPTDGPYEYVGRIFDRVEQLVAQSETPVSIVRTPEEVAKNKREGRLSLMLAVENALAVEDDLTRIGRMKERGVVYVTLCHNGDNQVCDSALKSNGTWGGLSPFGTDVVREMNSRGVMVDLSHAAEKTFYDVMDVSTKPVVCSHSNCKALCAHERNLTDDQLRALARKGGVCQLTIYEGFVKDNPSEADIKSWVDHVDHAIRVMGVECVGIGTDFDGGGGIRGLRDVGEMVSVTYELLRRRYSEEDLKLIWGGNWLRVMKEVQNV